MAFSLASLSLLIPILLLFLLVRLAYRCLIKWRCSPLHTSVPSADGFSYLFGNMAEIAREPFMAPQLRWWKATGFRARVIRFFGPAMKEQLLVLHPSTARAVLRNSSSSDAAFPKLMPIMEKYIGKGLVTLNGSDWQRHRSAVQPAFDGRHVSYLVERHVPPLADALCTAWEKLPPGTPIPLDDHLNRLTLDIIGRSGFGHEFRGTEGTVRWAQKVKDLYKTRVTGDNGGDLAGSHSGLKFDDLPPRDDRTDDPIAFAYGTSSFDIVRRSTLELMLGFWYTKLMMKLNLGKPARRSKLTEDLNNAIDDIIKEQRERCMHSDSELFRRLSDEDGSDNTAGARTGAGCTKPVSEFKLRRTPRSILELLMSVYSKLTNEELREEVKTFVFAGSETTGTAINLTIFAMCTHPRGEEIKKRLYEEVLEIWPDTSVPLSVDVVNNMPYLDAVLKEVLRVYPPVGVIHRTVSRDFEIEADVIVPKGTMVWLSIYLLHMNPIVWGERAKEFIPERWLGPEERQQVEINHAPPVDTFAYLPFSGGGRQCIGKGMAMVEAKIIIATIVRRFKFQIAREQKNTTFVRKSFVTLHHNPPFLAEMQTRKD